MNLRPGEIVTISNYSGINPFKSIVYKIEDNYVLIKLTKEFAVYNLFINDDIEITYEINENLYICKSVITDIYPLDGVVKISIVENIKLSNKRVSQRYLADILVEILQKNSERKTAYVKNISMTGIALKSDQEYNEGNKLDIGFIIGRQEIFIQSEIVWKVKTEYGYEYGLRFMDKSEALQDQIGELIEEIKNKNIVRETALRSL